MGKTVSDLEDSLTFVEYQQWQLFDQESPIGDERYDLLNALLCYANAGSKDAKIENFIPKWKPTSKEEVNKAFKSFLKSKKRSKSK